MDLPRWNLDDHPDADAAATAYWARQAQLTKPPRSLGRLEDLGAQLARLQRAERPVARPAACVLFASDHPVAARGVSAYPIEVTRAMVANFASGGAASTVMCRALGIEQRVIDVGVRGAPSSGVHRAAVAELPVGDLVVADAMPRATYVAALAAGAEAIAALGDVKLVALGEMGIGNSTCAAAVGAAILGRPARELVGPGTGVAGAALAAKLAAVEAALVRIGADAGPIDGHVAMQAVGGRELAALMGAMAAAAERRIAVLVDGFIATAAALALCAVAPGARKAMIFAHRSREPGHARMLAHLDARPLLELELALGEATGALAALPLCDLACAITAEMATFAGAGVPDRA
ncbi:MAG: nicotinate-nucleotide--dimethylbenzimidazole phosphoribosyltransferase [Deltaproteobacteria bacterium]|nr:nicotinate-nucleotide--dimethylbenzimidazole phosphoribosyltransferase [Deltaproteobacteria bacterium]